MKRYLPLLDGDPTPASSIPANPTGQPVTIDKPFVPKVTPTPKPGGVAQKREPSAEELGVEFNADLSLLGEEVSKISEAPKKEEVAPVAKPLPAKADAVPVPGEKSAVVEPVVKPAPAKPSFTAGAIPLPSAQQQQKQRDYSGFSDQETKILKSMSNEAFEHTSKLIKEHKELSGLKGATFLQHPQAYQLDPQFQKLNNDASYYDREAKFWEQQLMLCADGKEWQSITKYNDDGTVVLSSPQPSSLRAQEQLRLVMGKAMNLGDQTRTQASQYANTFQQRIQHDSNNIQQVLAQKCPWVADAKQMEHKINIPEIGEIPLSQIHSDFVNQFPLYQRNTIGVQVAGHMMVALQLYGNQIRELENGKHVAEIKAEEALQVEPTSELTSVTDKKKDVNGVSEFKLPSFLNIP